MKKRFDMEKIMEKISIIATILMGMVSLYRGCIEIKRNTMKLVNRDDSAGS